MIFWAVRLFAHGLYVNFLEMYSKMAPGRPKIMPTGNPVVSYFSKNHESIVIHWKTHEIDWKNWENKKPYLYSYSNFLTENKDGHETDLEMSFWHIDDTNLHKKTLRIQPE